MLLSSHLLDEVEKTCDVAAIVDEGRVVAQGTIAELVGGGARAIDIVCHAPSRRRSLLAAVPGVARAADHDGAHPRRRSPRGAGRPRDRHRAAAPAARPRRRRRARRAGRHLARGPVPDHDDPPGGPILMLDLRLIRAEILKLRRRRGMLAVAVLLTSASSRWLRRQRAPARRRPRHALRPGRRRDQLQGRASRSSALMASVVGVIVGAHRRRRGHRVRRLPRPGRHRPLAHGAVRARASSARGRCVLPILGRDRRSRRPSLSIALDRLATAPDGGAIWPGTASACWSPAR